MPKTTLKGLLPQELRKGLTPAEEILLAKVQQGESADFRNGDKETDKPENAGNWGDNRRIRADLLYWLCVDREASELVHAKGIRIDGAKVEGPLDFDGATLPHRLCLTHCAIPEKIILRDAQTRTIILSGSHTGPITADRLITQGAVFLRDGFHAKGAVRLLGANIGGPLSCTGATFENPRGTALNADRLTTQGGVSLRGTQTKGEVRLSGADLKGNLACDGATFENPGGQALSAERLSVKGGLFWRSMKERPIGAIDLVHAKVGRLVDDAESWPLADNVWLDGFEYEAFGVNSPRTAKERLHWFALQPQKPFHPQPYEQLAKVFKQMGREADARKVLIAKQDALRKYGELSRMSKVWKRFLGWTIAHGYKPWRVLWWIMVPMIVIGSGVFSWAYDLQIIDEVKKSAPPFSPFIYSLEVFVPLVDLHQESYYLPNAKGTCSAWGCGAWFRAYFWFHIVLGWVSSTLLVAALTGLVRKE
jgi:hypothetical protein